MFCFYRNNQILERHLNKVYEVIEESLKMMEDDDGAIHTAALPCVTQFPWSVSLNYFSYFVICLLISQSAR